MPVTVYKSPLNLRHRYTEPHVMGKVPHSPKSHYYVLFVTVHRSAIIFVITHTSASRLLCQVHWSEVNDAKQ